MFDLVGLGRGALDRLAATNLPGALNCVRHLKSLAEPASKVLNLPVYRSMAQLSLAEPADEVRAWGGLWPAGVR
jgi:hypothetical protein